jgi:DNA-binding transcriptional LysR family regulator
MDVKDLKYFVAVYEAGGFSRACLQLGTVQSNVSTRIRALEKSLGVILFERRYREVTPTEAGAKLYARAKQLIAELDDARQLLKPAGSPVHA